MAGPWEEFPPERGPWDEFKRADFSNVRGEVVLPA